MKLLRYTIDLHLISDMVTNTALSSEDQTQLRIHKVTNHGIAADLLPQWADPTATHSNEIRFRSCKVVGLVVCLFLLSPAYFRNQCFFD